MRRTGIFYSIFSYLTGCLALLIGGCGAFPTRSAAASADAGAQVADAGLDAVAPAEVGPDGLVSPGSSPVGAWWVQRNIGNCIDYEEWLSFQVSAAFTHTIVDRNACQAHSVTASPGKFTWQAQVLQYDWNQGNIAEHRRFTAAVIEGFVLPPLVEPEPGAVTGTRALNRMAFARQQDGTYLREDDRESGAGTAQASVTDMKYLVTFAEPLVTVQQPAACKMTVEVTANVGHGPGPTTQAGETFTLPCKYAPVKETGWLRITADGFEDSQTSDAWSKFFEQKGWWKKYPAQMSNALYDGFRPVLYFQPGKPEVLFHDVGHAWFTEMTTPPPESVP